MDKTDKLLKTLKSRPEIKTPIATDLFIPNLSGDHSKGHTGTPNNNLDIANKEYVDGKFDGTDAYFFHNSPTVGNEEEGKSLYIYRLAPEGSGYLRINLSSANNTYMRASGNFVTSGASCFYDLGDASGTNKLYIRDSAFATVATIDSNGGAWFGDDILLENNKKYKIKNTAGTAKDLLTLSTADLFTIGDTSFGRTLVNGGYVRFDTDSGEKMRILAGGNVGIGTTTPPSKLTVAGLINMKNYTVATLPAGTMGDIAYVTDALAPAFLTIIVGGGAVVTPVFFNGTNWVAM